MACGAGRVWRGVGAWGRGKAGRDAGCVAGGGAQAASLGASFGRGIGHARSVARPRTALAAGTYGHVHAYHVLARRWRVGGVGDHPRGGRGTRGQRECPRRPVRAALAWRGSGSCWGLGAARDRGAGRRTARAGSFNHVRCGRSAYYDARAYRACGRPHGRPAVGPWLGGGFGRARLAGDTAGDDGAAWGRHEARATRPPPHTCVLVCLWLCALLPTKKVRIKP